MNKPITKGFLAILLMTAISLAACGPKGPGILGQVLKNPFSSQIRLPSSEQAIPVEAIKGLYQSLGGEAGVLGKPVSMDLEDAGNGWKMWHYGCGRIYSNPKDGTFEVYGAILNQWLALGGGMGPIGYPAGHPEDAFDGKGKRQAFQNAVLLWQGSGPVEIFSSLTSLDLIDKAKIGLRK